MTRRAFHSATLLPNGEVLLLGGLGSADHLGKISRDEPADVPLVSRVEVYDPKVGSFRELTVIDRVEQEDSGALRRIFHQVLLMTHDPGASRIRLRVFGGLTTQEAVEGLGLRWIPAQDDSSTLLAFRLPFAPTANTRMAAMSSSSTT